MAYPFKKPSVIINMAAGSVSDISEDIKALFETHGHPVPIIHKFEPEDLADIFKTVGTDGTDLLVIYGGDGIIKSGAEIAKKTNIPFIDLPGGTMNILPKALYGTHDWRAGLELALKQENPRWQAAGMVNDHVFFCGDITQNGKKAKFYAARDWIRTLTGPKNHYTW